MIRSKPQRPEPTPTLHENGTGSPVVLVHGTPSSSFEFRHVVESLADHHRSISIDHLGFGASDKSPDHDYSLAAHQRRFADAASSLDLRDAVFVLHDFGAAIALPWMLAQPERIRGVVLLNTFLWPVSGGMRWVAWFYSTAFGRWLYRKANLSAKYLLPWAWGKRRPLTRELHAQYLAPFRDPNARHATSALPGELIGTTLRELTPRAPELSQWPLRAVWGMADPMVGPSELERWRALLPSMEVDAVPDAGHFVADEAPEAVVRAVLSLSETHCQTAATSPSPQLG